MGKRRQEGQKAASKKQGTAKSKAAPKRGGGGAPKGKASKSILDSETENLFQCPRISMAGDGLEFFDADGKFLGHLPSHDRDRWMLHLIRATDPLYPSLMDEEFQWLANVKNEGQRLNRTRAEDLLSRYLLALENMERHLVRLFSTTQVKGFKRAVASHLQRFYKRIERHAIERDTNPMEDEERGAAKARHDIVDSEEWKDAKANNPRHLAASMAAEVTGKMPRKRWINSAIEQWTRDQMFDVWELIHQERQSDRRGRQPTAMHEVFPPDRWYVTGVSFPEFWHGWLRGHLESTWEAARPRIDGRTESFKKQESQVLTGAALFWVGYLRDNEPERRKELHERVEAAILRAMKSA